jgi:hypothetical protein
MITSGHELHARLDPMVEVEWADDGVWGVWGGHGGRGWRGRVEKADSMLKCETVV